MEIVSTTGIASPWSRARFAAWLEQQYELPAELATKLARATRQAARELHGDTVDEAELPRIAARLVGRALAGRALGDGAGAASVGPLRRVGTPSLALLDSLGVGTVVDLVGGLARVLTGFFGNQGFMPDPNEPGSLVKEIVGFLPPFDDQKAPEIDQLDYGNPVCCETGMGRAISVDVTMRVTDRGGVGNSSGVTRVRVCGVSVEASGAWFLGPCAEQPLTDDEEERSEDEWVPVTVRLCVSCAFVRDGQLPIVVRVTDDDDNERILLRRIPFPRALQQECCGAQ